MAGERDVHAHGIAAYRAQGQTFLVTANEGDARDRDDFSDEARLGDGTVALIRMRSRTRPSYWLTRRSAA